MYNYILQFKIILMNKSSLINCLLMFLLHETDLKLQPVKLIIF